MLLRHVSQAQLNLALHPLRVGEMTRLKGRAMYAYYPKSNLNIKKGEGLQPHYFMSRVVVGEVGAQPEFLQGG